MLKENSRKILLSIFLWAFTIRLGLFLFYKIELFPDAQYYKLLGSLFLESGTIESYKVMPLYPILTGIKDLLGIGNLLDIFISAASAMVIFLLSFELFGNRLIAIISSLLWAIYPFSIFYSISGLTETTFTFLLLLCFLFLYKKKFRWAFVIAILSILVRPTLDYLMPVLILVFGLFIHRMGWKESLLLLPRYALIYCLMMSPWWIHNYHKYDSFVRLNLGDGTMWYEGNNPQNTTGGVGKIDSSLFGKIKNPVLRNNAMKEKAFKWIQTHPNQFIHLIALRLKRFWNISPNSEDYKNRYYIIISILSFLPLLIGTVIFLFLTDRSLFVKVTPIFLLFLYLSLIHGLTVGSIRYRFPLEGFMIIFTAFVISKILKYTPFYHE